MACSFFNSDRRAHNHCDIELPRAFSEPFADALFNCRRPLDPVAPDRANELSARIEHFGQPGDNASRHELAVGASVTRRYTSSSWRDIERGMAE